MEHYDIEQGSMEWFAMRAGKVTASKIADVMSKGKGGAESAGRRNYRAQLVAERLTGVVAETFTSGEMQWGISNEPAARECYEFKQSVKVKQVCFVDHPTIENAGASPDGMPPEGNLEIKCPNTANHIDMLIKEKIDSKYIKQMQFQMACTGRPWCDFVSYDPRLDRKNQLFIKRVMRDNVMIEEINAEVHRLLSDVTSDVAMLNAR